jgi:uncharacterized protein (TIGR02646 family)
MKYIKKGQQPQQLISWAAVNAGRPSLNYADGKFPRSAVITALISEQGGICAYTMIRIDQGSCHIEHLKPQKVSKDEKKLWETAAYANLVACFPKTGVQGAPRLRYGAEFRADSWDLQKFITPLNAACEVRIRFRMNGEIHPARATDSGAEWTIKTLGLDDAELTDIRRDAIEGLGVSLASAEPLSAPKTKRLISLICQPNNAGQFKEYCLAIKHAAEQYLALLQKRAKKTKYVRAARKRRQR